MIATTAPRVVREMHKPIHNPDAQKPTTPAASTTLASPCMFSNLRALGKSSGGFKLLVEAAAHISGDVPDISGRQRIRWASQIATWCSEPSCRFFGHGKIMPWLP